MCDLQIGRLSEMDSDFAAFVQHAGVPSIDLYYGKGILFCFGRKVTFIAKLGIESYISDVIQRG